MNSALVSGSIVGANAARAVAEAAREQEWAARSFVCDLFLGRLRLDLSVDGSLMALPTAPGMNCVFHVRIVRDYPHRVGAQSTGRAGYIGPTTAYTPGEPGPELPQ